MPSTQRCPHNRGSSMAWRFTEVYPNSLVDFHAGRHREEQRARVAPIYKGPGVRGPRPRRGPLRLGQPPLGVPQPRRGRRHVVARRGDLVVVEDMPRRSARPWSRRRDEASHACYRAQQEQFSPHPAFVRVVTGYQPLLWLFRAVQTVEELGASAILAGRVAKGRSSAQVINAGAVSPKTLDRPPALAYGKTLARRPTFLKIR